MRLSDAIALGRMTVENFHAGKLANCALGMAAKATGCELYYMRIEDQWPWLREEQFPSPCPYCGRELFLVTATMMVAHLFDSHVMGLEDWTLDQLIDWVRSVEPVELTAPSPTDALAMNEETLRGVQA